MVIPQQSPPNPTNIPASTVLDPSLVDHSAHTPPHSNVTAAIDPTPALAGDRFVGADASVQHGPTRCPQPFQRPLTTVLDDVLDLSDGGTTSRTGIDPDESSFDYNFTNCDDSDFKNVREGDIQRSIHMARASQRERPRVSNATNSIHGSRFFPNACVPGDASP